VRWGSWVGGETARPPWPVNHGSARGDVGGGEKKEGKRTRGKPQGTNTMGEERGMRLPSKNEEER
jgi:hypothetical protein